MAESKPASSSHTDLSESDGDANGNLSVGLNKARTEDSADIESSEDISAFTGDILYQPNGTAIIVENSDHCDTSPENIDEAPKSWSSSAPGRAIHFVTILNSISDQKTSSFTSLETKGSESPNHSTQVKPGAANYGGKPASVLNFAVHTLADGVSNTSDGGDGDTKDLLLRRLLDATGNTGDERDNKGLKRRPILMCFPCRLTFGAYGSFVSHASSAHCILPNERENELLRRRHLCSVIQETVGGRAIMCFLEPVHDNQGPEDATKSDDAARHLEGGTASSSTDRPLNPTEETPTADISADVKDARHSSSNVKMEDASLQDQTPKTIDQEEKDATIGAAEQERETDAQAVSVVQTCGGAKITPADLSHSFNVKEKVAPTATKVFPLSDSDKAKRILEMMTTTSQDSPRASLNNNTKVMSSGKSNDQLFGGSGTATVDPFQMSLFQSRNSCKTLKCPRCNWHYKYRQTLDAHMKEKHADETSDCIYCNTNQPHPRLSRGESYACGYKPFKCEVCNYSTTTKGNLSIHMQSDKHLYNVKTLQHRQQNKEKLNGSTSSVSNSDSTNQTGTAVPARLLAEKQEQFQNLQRQARKPSSPDSTSGLLVQNSTPSRTGSDLSSSPSSTRRQHWRCEWCNYETDIPRNLRIHMQSEKHAHNVALAGVTALQRQQDPQNPPRKEHSDDVDNLIGEESNANSSNNSPGLNNAVPSMPHMDQQSPSAMTTLYYYLAALQSSMQPSQSGNPQSTLEEREKQQKQFLAQQQQFLIAQQYQQMLAQLAAGSSDGGAAAPPLLQQQLFLQQLQMWRMFQQGDGAQLFAKPDDVDSPDTNNPPSTSNKFLFSCGVCCNFSCNDLESMCAHVRALRYPKTSDEENEWVSKSPGDGYLCKICNYGTQLKTNFSLHCKTEKHTSKLQLINHIREGGEPNEHKVSYAIAGTNMNKVTCNGCRHSSTSIDKLRIHCSTDRHQDTLTMCHYLDKMLKDAELNKGLQTSEEISSHHLLCRPCSYHSKFVVEMIQHLKCQNHQEKVHRERQQGNVLPADIVAAEPDQEQEKMEEEDIKSRDDSRGGKDCEEDEGRSNEIRDVYQKQTHQCQFCNFETQESNQLQLHTVTQHSAQSVIKCPMCPEYLDNTALFQDHLIQVHKLTGERPDTFHSSKEIINSANKIGGILEAIQMPFSDHLGEHPNLESSGRSQTDRSEEPWEEGSRCEQSFPDDRDESTNAAIPQVRSEVRNLEHVKSKSPDTAGSMRCGEWQEIVKTSEKLERHIQAPHDIETAASTEAAGMNIENDKNESMDVAVDANELEAAFANPSLLLSKICRDPHFADKAMQDPRFAQVWQELGPPFSCSICEETFVKKMDLLDHLRTKSVHKTAGNTVVTLAEERMGPNANYSSAEGEKPRDQIKLPPTSGAISMDNEPYPSGKHANDSPQSGDNQGISKRAHKRVLEDVGFDQVAHFVENRSSDNRERTKRWKMEQSEKPEYHFSQNTEQETSVDGNNNNLPPENLHDTNTTEKLENAAETEGSPSATPNPSTPVGTKLSPLTCERCGKEFSNMWILKVHENKVHGLEMSREMLEEFVQGYTKWYWDSFKQNSDCKETSDNSAFAHDRDVPDASLHDATTLPSAQNSDSNEEKGFNQVALQALAKNYPGLLSSYGTLPSQIPQLQPSSENHSKLQQQQALLQVLMATQTQSALHQQQQRNKSGQPQESNQTSASSIMNTLIDQLYGAAMHGAIPGFMDPMAVMGLLQQQQQSRVAPPGGMIPYQLLAMRYLQHQQMQQLLMYPAMAAGGSAMPFISNLAENPNHQQMLAAFATSLLTPGLSPDANNPMMANPIASALHAYQLQAAAAAASMGEHRPLGKDPAEQDSAKMVRMQQHDNNANSIGHNHSQQAAEIPAKRPRTRITDDQLKVLRANFDINTSPSEEQISEMAFKTNLPPKVIKHWFRNTLFKERQRSKDSPYNFNIPPMTSLEDVKDDFVRSSDANREDSVNDISDQQKEDSQTLNKSNEVQTGTSEDNQNANQNDQNALSMVETSRQLPDNAALRIIQSLSEAGNNPTDVKNSFLAKLVPNLHRVSEADKCRAASLAHASDLSRRLSAEKDQNMRRDALSEATHYAFGRSGQEYPYPNSSQSSLSTITRRTPRTRFSDYQLKVLQEFFDKNAYPKDEDLDKLSRMLELSTRVIVVWFQNARQKARKSYEMQQGSLNSAHHSNGLPALQNYSRKRQSPPSSPQQSHALLGNPKSFPSSKLLDSKGLAQLSRELGTHDVSPGFPIPVKQEPKLSDSNNPSAHKSHHGDTALSTMAALKHHENLHSSSRSPSIIQQYKMNFPSIIEGMMQGSSGRERDSRRSSSKSPEQEERKYPRDLPGIKASNITPHPNQTIGDIIRGFGFSQMKPETHGTQTKPEHFVPGIGLNAPGMLPSQFGNHTDGMHGNKRNLSPTQGMMPASMASPNGHRGGKMARKGINDNAKDPKRLRTTITPEQLEFLYQQYLVDSSPSRKVIEQISEVVGLKKRVVQVWFQNTRARERKGQFRSVGRITLGMPQICPHCRVTFRTKADLDAHVRYRHMQSPSAVALSNLSQTHGMSSESSHGKRSPTLPVSNYPSEMSASSREDSVRSPPKERVDYREIFQSLSKQIQEKQFGNQSTNVSSSDPRISAPGVITTAASETEAEPPSSPKRRKISDADSPTGRPFVTSPSTTRNITLSSKTAEIYKAVTEQIFGPKAPSVDIIAQRLQSKVTSSEADLNYRQDANQQLIPPSASENHGSPRMATSSPESISSSTGSSFMVPLKRYRTQMTSLQVRSLKHCFAEYKTPTLLECEVLGAQINLPKRVIQVWFQNARAKEKKARQGDQQLETNESPAKPRSSCDLCPEKRFASQQEYRIHFFSEKHLQSFINSCDRDDGSDDQSRRSPSSDADEFAQNESTASEQHRHFSPSPPMPTEDSENKFRISAFAAKDESSESQPHRNVAYASLLATSPNYHEFAAMQKLMSAASAQNGSDSQPHVPQEHNIDFGNKSAWIQQALLRGRMGGD